MDAGAGFDRRHFLATAAAAAATPLGFSSGSAAERPRELSPLRRATEWLNSPPVTPESLAGKVVLVNFCTYTCINWLRTLPYLRAWARGYAPGLVLLGVHTPEFSFEQRLDNVRRSLQQMGLEHPIVLDNDYAIWHAFDNHFWPALYFIDARGRIRHRHFGEGEYVQSERTIERLLQDSGASQGGAATPTAESHAIEKAADWSNLRSPEIYCGYARTAGFASRGGIRSDRPRLYEMPGRLRLNQWALAGEWTVEREAAILAGASGSLACGFHARDLHLVLGSGAAGRPVRFRVTLDGAAPGDARGADVDRSGGGTVAEPRLYQLVRQPAPVRGRQFQIEFLDPGAEAFAFTFG